MPIITFRTCFKSAGVNTFKINAGAALTRHAAGVAHENNQSLSNLSGSTTSLWLAAIAAKTLGGSLGTLLMTYYSTKAAAQALADHLTMHELQAWSYQVHGSPRGFYVAVFDDDGHFLGTL